VTRLDKNGERAKREVKIAREVSKAIGIEWTQFNMKKPTLKDIQHLITLKDGLNYAGMSFILSFFKQIKEVFGKKVIYYTGDGGDKVLPNLSPTKKINDVDELVNYIINKNFLFDLSEVEALTMTDKNDLKIAIAEHVKKYPEEDLSQKYVHFLIFERGFKWLFEGEDRNRFYFWTVTPFYSVNFFNHAINISNKQKRHYRIYRKFLKNLYPEVAKINNAAWNISITSPLSYFRLLILDILHYLPTKLKNRIKKRFRISKNYVDKESKTYIQECIEVCPIILDYLSKEQVERLIDGSCSKEKFDILLTIIGYIREVSNSKI